MSNQVGMLKMRTANKKQQRIPQNFMHISTTNFYMPQVCFIKKVMPGEHVKIRTTMNIKPRALSMPAEIQLEHNLRAFWVPNFTTHKDWFAYRTNTPFTTTEGYAVHENDYYTYNSAIVKMFVTNPVLRKVGWHTDTQPLDSYDINIAVFNPNRNTLKGFFAFDLTRKGRLMLSLLQQLGYEINWQIQQTPEGATADQWDSPIYWESRETNLSEEKLVIRPILSLCKVMIDWYVPSQYQNSYQNYLEQILMENKDYKDISGSAFGTWMSDLMLTICYKADRFNAAWKNPTGPNNESSKFNIQDNSVVNLSNPQLRSAATNETNGTINSTGTAIIRTAKDSQGNQTNYVYNLSDYILRALNAIQNYTTRNRIAGYRPVDRFLAHFGIHLDYVHTKRSQHIKSNVQYMYGNDIINLAQNGNQEPAKYMVDEKDTLGGKGSVMSAKNGIDIEWKADDDGWIIVIGTIVTGGGYYQGIKNHVLGADWRQSLYNPEFDNLGTTGINKAEVFHSAMYQGQWIPDNVVWGYEPTYMGMKVGYDTISGDFRIPTLNTGLEAMHTLRTFNETGSDVGETVSSAFLKADGSEYNRIFDYAEDDVDHFVTTIRTVNSGTMPVESVSESLPITDGEGNTTKFEYGGNYMN